MKKLIENCILQLVFVVTLNSCFAQGFGNTSLDYEVAPFAGGYKTFNENGFFGIKDSINNIVCKPKYDYIILNGAQNAIIILPYAGATSIIVEKEFWQKEIELFGNHFAIANDSTGVYYIDENGNPQDDKVAINDEIMLMRSYHLSRIDSSCTSGYGNEICTFFFDLESNLVRNTCIRIQSSEDQFSYTIYDKKNRLVFESPFHFGANLSQVNQCRYLKYDDRENGECDTIYFKELQLKIDSIEFGSLDMLSSSVPEIFRVENILNSLLKNKIPDKSYITKNEGWILVKMDHEYYYLEFEK